MSSSKRGVSPPAAGTTPNQEPQPPREEICLYCKAVFPNYAVFLEHRPHCTFGRETTTTTNGPGFKTSTTSDRNQNIGLSLFGPAPLSFPGTSTASTYRNPYSQSPIPSSAQQAVTFSSYPGASYVVNDLTSNTESTSFASLQQAARASSYAGSSYPGSSYAANGFTPDTETTSLASSQHAATGSSYAVNGCAPNTKATSLTSVTPAAPVAQAPEPTMSTISSLSDEPIGLLTSIDMTNVATFDKENPNQPTNASQPHLPNGLEDRDPEEIEALKIRAYVDRDNKMEYYNVSTPADVKDSGESEQDDGHTSDNTPRSVDIESSNVPKGAKDNLTTPREFAFPAFTPLPNFQEYLQNPENMTLDQLNYRLSKVTSSLLDYQQEFDTIDKELYEYEEQQKHQLKLANELAKAIQDENQVKEDEALTVISKDYAAEIRLSRKDFVDFQVDFKAAHPDKTELLELITKLRDVAFVKAFRKRQKALNVQETKKDLIDKPLAEAKQTKDEAELERRKRSRLTDRVTFDDMNQADAYGFVYNPDELKRGNQPVPVRRPLPKAPTVADNHVDDQPRGRGARSQVKQFADGQPKAPSPSREEPLLGKRSRTRTKKVASGGGSSTTGQSASVLPPNTVLDDRPRFKSGKTIGRPRKNDRPAPVAPVAAKSKLDQVIQAEEESSAALVNSALPPSSLPKVGVRAQKRPLPEASGVEGDDEPAPKKAKRVKKLPAGVKKEVELKAQDGSDAPVLQSTEHDVTAPSSRPTTSSSNNTSVTADSQFRTHTSTRENSMAPLSQVDPVQVNGGKKRKVGGEEALQKAKPSKRAKSQAAPALADPGGSHVASEVVGEVQGASTKGKKGTRGGYGEAKRMATIKRRNMRKLREKQRVANGGAVDPDVVYNSTEEGFVPSEVENMDEDDSGKAASVSGALAGPAVIATSSRKKAPRASRERSVPLGPNSRKIIIKRKPAAKGPEVPAPTLDSAVAAPVPGKRARKPTAKAQGFDGAYDDSDVEYEDTPIVFPELKRQDSRYESEYHLFQAITSPGNELGKRVPKPIHKNLVPWLRSTDSPEEE